MLPDSDPEEIINAYERDRARLTALAEELELEGEQREELIQGILVASLARRLASDRADWLEATFRSAAESLQERF